MNAPDPEEMTAPIDPAVYRSRRGGLGPLGSVSLAVICVAAGAGAAVLAPRLIAHRPQPHVAADRAAGVEPALVAQPASPVALPPLEAELAPSAEVERLSDRVAQLESRESRAAEAASGVIAAAALVEATQGSGPFAEELAAIRAAAPNSPELAALARLADQGAPSRAALAESFPDYAARAASASRAPADGAGLGARILYAVSKVITVRRIGDASGQGADAQLARAEMAVEDGDLDTCLKALDKLPTGAREAIAPWRVRAERRAEIDRQAAALRARALRDLAGAGPAPGRDGA